MNKELNELFLIQCKLCGSIDIGFYPSGYDGDIEIYCKNCDNEVEVKV